LFAVFWAFKLPKCAYRYEVAYIWVGALDELRPGALEWIESNQVRVCTTCSSWLLLNKNFAPVWRAKVSFRVTMTERRHKEALPSVQGKRSSPVSNGTLVGDEFEVDGTWM
jgi:hypothetical protein